MSDFTLRRAKARDIGALTALWKAVFGDSDEYIAAFYAALPGLGAGVVAETDGALAGMAHTLVCSLSPGDIKCAYVYAVAVDERRRAHGLGSALTRAAAQLGYELGAKAVCTEPAEPSLYSWYERVISVKPALFRKIRSVPARPGEAGKISSAEYGEAREALLRGAPHVVLPPEWLRLQGLLLEEMGGGYYKSGGSICAAFPSGGRCLVQELIGEDSAASAVCASLGLTGAEIFCDCAGGEAYMACTAPEIFEKISFPLSLDTVELE